MNRPKVLLADEPSGNLDSENAEALHDLFFQLRDRSGQTIVLVTHNESLARGPTEGCGWPTASSFDNVAPKEHRRARELVVQGLTVWGQQQQGAHRHHQPSGPSQESQHLKFLKPPHRGKDGANVFDQKPPQVEDEVSPRAIRTCQCISP